MGTFSKTIDVIAGDKTLEGFVTIPENAEALVVFVHGSGSSRHSPRNQAVAKVFSDSGMATLLFDLLTAEEEIIDLQTRELRFDIPMLSSRVVEVIRWLSDFDLTKNLKIGLIGSSTGASAALIAAAIETKKVSAVVSRGGRPDLAGNYLSRVEAPSLLIVGGNDFSVIELNREAYDQMTCEKRLDLVPGATHLFEEPGTLEEASELANQWFLEHLVS